MVRANWIGFIPLGRGTSVYRGSHISNPCADFPENGKGEKRNNEPPEGAEQIGNPKADGDIPDP